MTQQPLAAFLEGEPTEAACFERLARLPCPCLNPSGLYACQACWKGEGEDNWIDHDTDCEPCSGTGLRLPGLSERCHGLPGNIHDDWCCGSTTEEGAWLPAPHDRLERLVAAMKASGFEGMWVGGSWAFWRIGSSPDVEPHLDPSVHRAALLALEAE